MDQQPRTRVALIIDKDDLGNPHQRNDATETVAVVLVDHGYKRQLSYFLSHLTQSFLKYRTIDWRKKEAKRFNAAREALIAAAVEFDAARAALEEGR